jgi:tetratricopeptide (TPR) repeat protein/2-polyprenyl-3-methyl-5-hydroxy-6-metoxy-1,4-benzoquinol methylase
MDWKTPNMGRQKKRKKKVAVLGNPVDLAKTLEDAIAHYKAGRLLECLQCCRIILKIDNGNPNILKLAGDLESQVGTPKQAEVFLSAAVELAPNDADAHYMLAGAQKEIGQIEDAVSSYQTALQINPDYIDAYNNLGMAQWSNGDFDAAEMTLGHLLERKPDHAQAYHNLSSVHERQRRVEDAVRAERQAIRHDPDNREFWKFLTFLYSQAPRMPGDDALMNDFRAILASDDLSIRPISIPAYELILSLPQTRSLITLAENSNQEFLIKDWLSQEVLESLTEPMILSYLAKGRILEFGLEHVFTNARRAIFLGFGETQHGTDIPGAAIDVLIAIAEQCFYNEYVFFVSDEETQALNRLENKVTKSLAIGDELQPEDIALYAAYSRLVDMPGFTESIAQNYAARHPVLSSLILHQVIEPLAERGIIPSIPSIGEISNDISQDVRAQYEENPFPRWRHPGETLTFNFKNYLRAFMPEQALTSKNYASAPKILVAGCGTGRHPINVARGIENSHVLAVDLSRASIAYGWRKAQEYGVSNVEFKHADILSLDSLQTPFDMIESCGVLHHMDDPEAGWKVLTHLLAPDGYMKIGLYSELARQSIVAARDFIAEHKIPSTIEGIRDFRKRVVGLPDDHPVKPTASLSDFFTASDCRDLLFHVQEHRFTIQRLKIALADLGLKFCGFHFDGGNSTFADFKSTYPDDPDGLSLENWEAFEIENPTTFIAMYNFFVKKAHVH